MREGNRPIGRACAGWMRNERGQQTHRKSVCRVDEE